MTLGWFFLLLIQTSLIPAQASSSLTVDFYRSPKSLFRSGQANLEDLKKKVHGQHQETLFKFNPAMEGKPSWLQEKDLLRPSDFGTQRQASHASSLEALSLYLKPKADSEIIEVLPPKSILEVETWGPYFSLVKHSNENSHFKTGFVRTDLLLSLVDLALFVRTHDNHWIPIAHNDLGWVITPKGNRIPFSQIKEIKIPENSAINKRGVRGFVTQTSKKNWIESSLKGHGRVFWLESSLTSHQTPQPQQSLTSQDLLKRTIHSVSFSQNDSQVGLVSSSGVFISRDGNNWKEFPQFKNQNLPLLMRSEKDFLVGWTRTVDGGKSFHPFINMKDWTELISKKLGESPSQIQLLQFYPHQRNQIRVEVETGKKKLLLEGTITNQALTAEKWFIVN